ncbi:hypothetical protein DXG01_016002 [Tephrocybe rancida]|nr:hypothetical protein DXG01_016002 [Tephrocybe rancida]
MQTGQVMRGGLQPIRLAACPTFQEPNIPDMNMEWEAMPMDRAHAHCAAYMDDPMGEVSPAVPFTPYVPDLSTNHHDAAEPQVDAYDGNDTSGSYSFENAHFAQSEHNQNAEFDHHQQAPYTEVDNQQVPYMAPGHYREPPYVASAHHHQAAYPDQSYTESTRDGYDAPAGSAHHQQAPYTESSSGGYDEAPELGLAQGSKHSIPDPEKDMQTLMDCLIKFVVYVYTEGHVFDPQDSPVPDTLSIGHASVAHSSTPMFSTPLDEFNVLIDHLQGCHQPTPIPAPTEKPKNMDAMDYTTTLVQPLSSCNVSQGPLDISNDPAMELNDGTTADFEGSEDEDMDEELFLASPTLIHEEDVELKMDIGILMQGFRRRKMRK